MDAERIERWFYAAITIAVAFGSWLVLGAYVGALVLALTLALIFYPVYRGLRRAVRSDSLAAAFTVLATAIVVFVPLAFFGVQLLGETTSLYGAIATHGNADIGQTLARYLHDWFPNAHLAAPTIDVSGFVQQILAWFAGNIGQVFSSIAQILFLAVLSLMGLFYFLKDGARLKQWVLDFAPLEPEYTQRIFGETSSALGSVVKGALAVAVLLGIVTGLGFFLFGISNPVFWGALTILASLIPVIGTWIVALPGIVYLLLTGHGAMALGLAIWSIAFTNIIGTILAPQFIHRGGLDIHPFIILLSVVGGISAFGPIGFLIGPFLIALLFSLLRIYPKMILRKVTGIGKFRHKGRKQIYFVP